jgi:hypothetical protein
MLNRRCGACAGPLLRQGRYAVKQLYTTVKTAYIQT